MPGVVLSGGSVDQAAGHDPLTAKNPTTPQMNVRRPVVLLLLLSLSTPSKAYEPAPENLAAREWFSDARFGVFLHWGVYSLLESGEWVLHHNKMTLDEYEPLAQRFNPEDFDADAWCRLFKESGVRYVTITSKHHDGFCMWDTDQTDWDIVDRTPFGRDVLK
ncbi:MAG: alpha-L-fucosidase, partial [Planctomycetota bacterium]